MFIVVPFFILFFGAHKLISAVPVDSKLLKLEGTSRRFDRLIHTVVRTAAGNDVIFPSVCPPACENLHQAKTYVTNSTNPNDCSCICPFQRPAYLSSIGTCVGKLSEDECPYIVGWNLETSTIPVVRLQPHSIILPDTSLNFEGVGIQNGESSCTIKKILYENVQTTLKVIAKELALFQLTSSNGRTILYFGGTEVDVAFLSGAVVVLKLECKRVSLTDFTRQACISLRVAGTSGRVSFRHDNYTVEATEWRIEIVFLLVVISVVVIVLIMTFVIWNICWSIKKRKLISNFQMQFVQQYRENQNQVQELAFSNKITGSGEYGNQEATLPQSFSRKRLIFSTEYFEHGQMTHPSPLAEQFLCDLRRVVDVARERIKQRRFLPTLSIICEEDDENIEHENIGSTLEETFSFCISSSPQYSPQSEEKSVDSGRESRENSDEDDEKQSGKLETTTNVAELVKSFDKSVMRPSYVPILLNSSIRKKNIQKMTIVPSGSDRKITNNKNSCVSNGLSMNNKDMAVHIPVSFSENTVKEKRKYAVFPSDGTFNKSLPRRVKQNPNTPANSIKLITE